MQVQYLSQKISGGGHGNRFQYSYLENPIDRGASQATVHRVAQSQTLLNAKEIGKFQMTLILAGKFQKIVSFQKMLFILTYNGFYCHPLMYILKFLEFSF